MTTKPLPWNYDFKFVVEEISNINDKAQVSIYKINKVNCWLVSCATLSNAGSNIKIKGG